MRKPGSTALLTNVKAVKHKYVDQYQWFYKTHNFTSNATKDPQKLALMVGDSSVK